MNTSGRACVLSIQLSTARFAAFALWVILVLATLVVKRDELVARHARVVRSASVAVAVRELGDAPLAGPLAVSTISDLLVLRRC